MMSLSLLSSDGWGRKRVNPFVDPARWFRYAIAMPRSVRIQLGGSSFHVSAMFNVLRPQKPGVCKNLMAT